MVTNWTTSGNMNHRQELDIEKQVLEHKLQQLSAGGANLNSCMLDPNKTEEYNGTAWT